MNDKQRTQDPRAAGTAPTSGRRSSARSAAGATLTCGAKTRAGTPCKRAPMPNGRCNLHGGKSLAGVDHPNAKTLRHSKHLPSRLLARYEEAEADPAMLELRAEIALVDARIAEVLAQLDTGESGIAWRRLKEARERFVHGQSRADQARAVGEMLQIVKDGSQEWMHWKDVSDLVERRRRLVESERRRMVEMQQTVTVAEVLALVRAVVSSVNEHADPAARRRIHADLSVLLGGHADRVVDPIDLVVPRGEA